MGQCVPALAGFVAAAQADVTAELSGIAAINAGIAISPPSIAGQITAVTQLLAALQAQLALSVTLGLPTVTVSLDVMLAAQLELEARLQALLALLDAMSKTGIAALSYVGDAQSYGLQMQTRVSSIAPSGNAVQAITFLATEPAAFAALGAVLLTG